MSIFRYLFCFRKPVVCHVEYLSIVIEDKILLLLSWKLKHKYKLSIPALKRRYRQQELSVINIEIRTTEPSFIVELLDNNYKVHKRVKDQKRIRFTDITPGDYQIRLIIDSNKNGRWDPGNYFQNIPPEPVVFYRAADGSTTIKGVKANWEIGTEGEMFITY